jgi:hypothetical protein
MGNAQILPRCVCDDLLTHLTRLSIIIHVTISGELKEPVKPEHFGYYTGLLDQIGNLILRINSIKDYDQQLLLNFASEANDICVRFNTVSSSPSK